MKTTRTLTLIKGLFFATLFIVSCKKSDLQQPASNNPESQVMSSYQNGHLLENGSVLAGGVTITAPTTVNVGEQFGMDADIDCGRISIERGYILASDGITRIYKGLSCASGNLLWEIVVDFQCYTNDAHWGGSFNEAGTYVFRTKHNASDGNCDNLGGANHTGECSFSGNQMYCFVIEAVEGCQTSFKGEAISCGNDRKAVYTLTSKDALSQIKIQGGLTNFTGDDAVVTIDGGNLTSSQSTPGGGSNRVITIVGSVGACEKVTISITWNSTNSGGTITGNWSIKNGDSEVAPSVAGLTCSN